MRTVVLLMALLAGGCVTHSASPNMLAYDWRVSRAIAAPAEAVVRVHGPPDDVWVGDDGVEFFKYESDVRYVSTAFAAASATSDGAVASSVSRSRKVSCVTVFEVYRGVVVDVSWKGACYSRGPAVMAMTVIEQGPRECLIIDKVLTSGPAARAGLRSGDCVFKVAGQWVASTEDLRRVLAQQTLGGWAEVQYMRDWQRKRAKVVFHKVFVLDDDNHDYH